MNSTPVQRVKRLRDGRMWVHDASRSAGRVRQRVMPWGVRAYDEVHVAELRET